MAQECVRLLEELFLMCTSVPTTTENISTTKLKGFMKNQDIKRHFFQNVDNFCVIGESTLLVAFVKNILSKLYSHCTQNCDFHYFLETRICFVTKNCSVPS